MSTSRSHTCELHSYCNELRREEKFSDIVIKVENRTFPCHRIILASALKYFRSMFSGNYNETTQKEVEIKGVKAADFELLLTHIYGGSVDLEENNVYRLLRISNYVGLDTLSNICEEYLIENKEKISLDMVLDVFVFASKLERTALVNEFAKPLAQNFLSVSKEEKLSSISRTEIEAIFSHLDLVKSRMSVLDFMDYWSGFHATDVDVFDRWLLKMNLPSDLLEWIKDKLKKNKIPSTDENETGETSDDTLGTERKLVFYDEYMDCDEFSEVQPDEIISSEISLYCQHYQTGSCYRYNFDTKSNRIQADGTGAYYDEMSSNKINFFKSVWIKDVQLVLVGHVVLPYIYNQITPYNRITPCLLGTHSASTKKYLAHCDSSSLKLSSQIAACGENIYFYTGQDFQMFNAELNKWTSLFSQGNLPVPITVNSNMISYENNLYLLGGQCLDNKLLTVRPSNEVGKFHVLENGKIFQRYDPRAGTWSRMPCMTHNHGRLSSCVHKGVLYATGGENLAYFEGLIQCYDFKAGRWRVLGTRMPKPKINHTVLGYGDRLFFVGGDDDFSWYSYDLTKGSWSDVLSVPTKRGSVQITRIWDAEVKV